MEVIYMSFNIFKHALALCLLLSVFVAPINARQFPLPVRSHLVNEQTKEKNLIMVLDVKQHEKNIGACAFSLATALKDKVAPIIASAHTLELVSHFLDRSEWHIYQKKNLVLLIPNDYLKDQGVTDPKDAGFDLSGWKLLSFDSAVAAQEVEFQTFEDLSQSSTQMICQTLAKNKANRWKVYALGHGAPDAHQICGLNLNDFSILLNHLQDGITTDFFVYQTCFGGSKNQLKAVYTNGSIHRKFNFPIISGSLTNSVSFAFRPSDVTFKEVFAQVNNSVIVNNKTRRLLQAVNHLNKGLDMASQFHATNNLLLVRLPGAESFEPAIDNQSVFAASKMPVADDQAKEMYANKDIFKCILCDKSVIQNTVDLSDFENFIIASSLPFAKQYTQQMILPKGLAASNTEITLKNITTRFASLLFPWKRKLFFIDKININGQLFEKVLITQMENGMGWSPTQTIAIGALDGEKFFLGHIVVSYSHDDGTDTSYEINQYEEQDAKEEYIKQYDALVKKHLSKPHVPLMTFFQEMLSLV